MASTLVAMASNLLAMASNEEDEDEGLAVLEPPLKTQRKHLNWCAHMRAAELPWGDMKPTNTSAHMQLDRSTTRVSELFATPSTFLQTCSF